MKNSLLKIFITIIVFIIILGVKNTVSANSIESINMDIYVDNNGNAEVTEIWNCYTNEGTECYHPYYNLGNSNITNFRVRDLTTTYTSDEIWNEYGTVDEKAYKCGINSIDGGVELCWGISKYGSNVYTVKYNISNFVSELTDSQMIYWTLIPYNFSNPIGDIKITIHADKYFEDTTDVWGYGDYGGLCYVKDGIIYMHSNGELKVTEYMTLLVKFNKETFDTSNYIDYPFEYYYGMAEKDAIKYEEYDEDTNEEEKPKKNYFFHIGVLVIIFYCIANWVKSIKLSKQNNNKEAKLKFDKKEIESVNNNINYYRDIPLNGNILRTYYIAYKYKIIKYKMDILGSIILMWLRDGKIKIDTVDDEIKMNNNNTVLIFENPENVNFENEDINSIYNMMYSASRDGILERNEFKVWCEENVSKLNNWFNDILKKQESKLIMEGLIKVEKNKKEEKHYTTQALKEKASEIAGFKKFLLDYTLIKEREVMELPLFEDYLIYAQLLGVAKQISKQFSEIYPNMIEQTNYNTYGSIISIDNYMPDEVYRNRLEIYREYKNNNTSSLDYDSARDYDSGGGGFSSGGGGGGSFGGGGGGGGGGGFR